MMRQATGTLLLLLAATLVLHGASTARTISGRIVDNANSTGLPFAHAVLLSPSDSSVIRGTVTDPEGAFRLEDVAPGAYLMEFRFLGYLPQRTPVAVPAAGGLDVGLIRLVSDAIAIDGVVVEGERAPFSYQIDRKVIEVGEMHTAVSGNATDVLENIPSVSVDIDGNVSLRGSGSFTVLIDGRPSVLEPQDALQQTPASSIASIEIITNPSAKYDPEGTAGIINIILKKEQNRGLRGTAQGNAGMHGAWGGDVLLEYKTEGVTAHGGLDYGTRTRPGTSQEVNRYLSGATSLVTRADGESDRARTGWGARAGLDLELSPSDVVGFGGRYGDREGTERGRLLYTATTPSGTSAYLNTTDRARGGTYGALHASYVHRFQAPRHELAAELFFSNRSSDEWTVTSAWEQAVQTAGKRTTEAGPSTDLRAKLDYVLPFGEEGRFEAGYQGEIDLSEEATGLQEFDPAAVAFVDLPAFTNTTRYDEREHAAYALYAGSLGRFGFQTGLRGEYTYRTVAVSRLAEDFRIDTWDYFPSLHLSYEFSKGHQLMASYTGRIERPGGWALEPFDTWTDATNVRRGNPALKPEYIDSYEVGYQTLLGEVNLAAELYHRVTNGKIERIQSVYAEGIALTTFANVGEDRTTGAEFIAGIAPFPAWDLTLMGNVYHYRVGGELGGTPFARESNSWRVQMKNMLEITPATQFQLTLRYNSPSVSAQGRREGSFVTDAALKQKLFEGFLTATLQARDLFSTERYVSSTEGLGFSSARTYLHAAPYVSLNLRFTLNNLEPERARRNEGGSEGGEEF